MFILERLFGIGCYAFALFITLVLMLHSDLKRSRILAIYLSMLMLMALFYKPYKTADLYRIFEIVQAYGSQSLFFFLRNSLIHSLSPAAAVMYWIFGKLHLSFALPVFSCFICYSIIFYVIDDCSDRFQLRRGDTAFLLFYIMSSGLFIPVIGGIRMMQALCLLLFCFYRIYIRKRVSVPIVLLSLIAVALHSIAIAITAIAFFLLLLTKAIKTYLKIIILFFFTVFAFLFVQIFDLKSLLEDKIDHYLYQETYFDIWEFTIGILSIIFSIAILLRMRKSEIRIPFFELSVGCSLLVAIVCINKFSIFHRFSVEVSSLMLLPLVAISVSTEAIDQANSPFRKNFLIWVILLFVANASRGSLSSLKFFEL